MEKGFQKRFTLGLLILALLLSGTETVWAWGSRHGGRGFHGHSRFAGRGVQHPSLHQGFHQPGFHDGFHRPESFLREFHSGFDRGGLDPALHLRRFHQGFPHERFHPGFRRHGFHREFHR